MDVTRFVCAVLLSSGFAAPAVHAQTVGAQAARAPAAQKPWRQVTGIGRVLDLSKAPIVIDEPGLYAIQRDWEIASTAADVNPELIRITADNVTLDLRGFQISVDISAPPSSTLLVITGRGAEVRNGGLATCCDGSVAIRATMGPQLHHLSIFSYETMTLEGNGTALTDSRVSLRAEAHFSSFSTVQRNTIACNRGIRCLTFVEGNVISDNTLTLFQGGGIEFVGDRNVAANNIIDATSAPDAFEAFDVEGDANVVRNNTVVTGEFNGHPLFAISGTANTLDGNIGAPSDPARREAVGMRFTADGNFYGDNRMAAQVPFDLGGTVQTDWGGNAGY